MKKNLLIGALLLGSFTAQSQLSIVLQQAAVGLTGSVDIEHASDGRLFVVRQQGVISIVESDMTVLSTPFLDIQNLVNDGSNEMGLLGVAFHPDYANNGFFFVNYTDGNGPNRVSRISRFEVTTNPDIADPNSEFVILQVSQPYSNHNAGDLMFGPDGYLYIPWGDGGSGGDPGNRAQNLLEPMGKLFRIDVDNGSPYSIPATNPYATAIDTLPEIWGVGLRNPWRASFDRLTNDLWIGDVGQNAREEVDFWPAGSTTVPNFGWRCYEANSSYNTSGGCGPQSSYVPPVSVHNNTGVAGGTWCSVIGGRVYRGPAFPQMQGHYIYTDYCDTDWYSLESDGSGGFDQYQIASNTGLSTIAAIGENAAGELFTCRQGNGRLYRICPDDPPVLTLDGNGILQSTQAVSYEWYQDGSLIPVSTQDYDPSGTGGDFYVIADIGNGCIFQSNTIHISTVGIDDINAERGISLFPNPSDESMLVQLGSKYQGNVRIEILDVRGQFVKAIDSVSTSVRVDTKDLANGQYQLAVRMNGSLEGIKSFVVLH